MEAGASGIEPCWPEVLYDDINPDYEKLKVVFDWKWVQLYNSNKHRFNNDEVNTKQDQAFKWWARVPQQGCAYFDVTAYMYYNEDLRKIYGNDLWKYMIHYITQGQYEDRITTFPRNIVAENTYVATFKLEGLSIEDIPRYAPSQWHSANPKPQ